MFRIYTFTSPQRINYQLFGPKSGFGLAFSKLNYKYNFTDITLQNKPYKSYVLQIKSALQISQS